MATPTDPNNSKKQQDSFMLRALHGRLLDTDLFTRNWLAITLGLIMILLYITNKYACQTKMEEIRELTRQLEVVETEQIRVRSEYMSRIRESAMQELVDSMHLGLHVQQQPPYRLHRHRK